MPINRETYIQETVDLFTPDKGWLGRGVRHFQDGRVSGVSGPYFYFDAPLFSKYLIYFSMKYVYGAMNVLQRFLKKGAITIGGNTLIRKDVFVAAGGFTTSITFWGDDTDTAIKLARIGTVVYDIQCIMHTSYRRFKKEGFFALTFKYQYHFFHELYIKVVRGGGTS
jgi:GT2 family glycosyltransferase